MKFEDQIEALSALQNAVRSNLAWQDSTSRMIQELSLLSERVKIYNPLEQMAPGLAESLNLLKAEQLEILDSLNLNIPKISPAIDISNQLLTSASLAIQTPEISGLLKNLTNNSMLEAVREFSKCLQFPQIEAANLALIRLNPILHEQIADLNGLNSFIKKMSVPTARILIRSDDILVDAERKLFVSAKEEDCTAQNSEMNVIASSIGLFDDITASELMELNNDLAIGSELALENDTAKHIRSIIAGWTEFTSFDCEYFYRARAIEENQAPYTVKNFSTAPEKYVGYGRYNHEGQCHYYVASSPNGACSEIRKHDRKAILQVATLKPRKPAKLIDLSDKTDGNTFLKYLRFEADPNERVPRAYLLPCFVTTCCRKTQIEGIKYYGSKEYDNYVTWDNSYYDVIKVSEVPYEQDK